jgi:dihydroorotate dehydrogenase
LQEKGPLLEILSRLEQLNQKRGRRPLLLKIAPDLTNEQLDDVVEVARASGIQGIVANNTTIARDGLRMSKERLDAIGSGGLSGAPLRQRSTEVMRYLRQRLPRPFVLIGVGGIDSAEAAMERLDAGADLVQVYTGLVYEGPALLSRINEAFIQRKRKHDQR